MNNPNEMTPERMAEMQAQTHEAVEEFCEIMDSAISMHSMTMIGRFSATSMLIRMSR